LAGTDVVRRPTAEQAGGPQCSGDGKTYVYDLPNDGYTFNEHAVHGPPDKIFEEAAFLERFRDVLIRQELSNKGVVK
jgi:hypothetical protein